MDDGILSIFELINEPLVAGGKPVNQLKLKSQHCFSYDVVGYGRYYAALQANNRIDTNVLIWQDTAISSLDICALEDGLQYRIIQAQHFTDPADGLRKTKLSLERLGNEYIIQD